MRKAFLYFSLLSGLLSGCKTDFDVNDKYTEINVIYGLLDSKDSITIANFTGDDNKKEQVQYFRITKAFLNNGRSANDIAKTPDSLYNKDWNVTLDEIVGGRVAKTFKLDTTTIIPRDAGAFAAPHQLLYKTPAGFKLNFAASYKITVTNLKSKNTSTATTELAGLSTSRASYPQSLQFIRGQYLQIAWNAGKNVRFYDLTLKIHYKEWHKAASPADTVVKVLEWPVLTSMLMSELSGSTTQQYSIDGNTFYDLLSSTLSADPTLGRKMTGTEINIQGGGDDLYTYIQVNRPTIGIVQKKSNYTNVNNGYGIFSSRTTTKYVLPIDGLTISKLRSDPATSKLGF
jgi:hypothetical protein